MNRIRRGLLPALLIVGALASADVLEAQGRGNGRDRAEDVDRRDRDDRLGGIGDIFGDRGSDRAEDRGPPFCRNGEGHPVHGREWCREKGFGLGGRGALGDIVYGDRDVYDRRIDANDFERAHSELHRALDLRYAELAARRPLDVQYQLELRREREREHENWHRRYGY